MDLAVGLGSDLDATSRDLFLRLAPGVGALLVDQLGLAPGAPMRAF